MKNNLKFLTAILLFIVANFATAHDSLSIENIWARTCRTNNTSAVYFQITNDSNVDEELLGARTDLFHMSEIHKTVTEKGVSQMVHIDRLVIPARKTVIFAPKGLHIMLMGAKQNLNAGDTFYLELDFKNAGRKIYKVKVK